MNLCSSGHLADSKLVSASPWPSDTVDRVDCCCQMFFLTRVKKKVPYYAKCIFFHDCHTIITFLCQWRPHELALYPFQSYHCPTFLLNIFCVTFFTFLLCKHHLRPWFTGFIRQDYVSSVAYVIWLCTCVIFQPWGRRICTLGENPGLDMARLGSVSLGPVGMYVETMTKFAHKATAVSHF